MNRQALVSIIMPVYNAEETIETSINSVLNQTYKAIELIVINDGSTDETDRLCERYADDPRVKYFVQENAGPSTARNLGLREMTGSFVTFIDSDDTFKTNAVELMHEAIKDADLVIAGYENVKRAHDLHSTNQVTPGLLAGKYSKDAFLNQYSELFDSQLVHYLWHKLYRSEKVEGLAFDDSVKIGEDLLFNLAYLKQIDKLTLIDKPVIEHVKDNEQSLTKTYQPDLFEYRKLTYLKSKAFLIDHDKWTHTNEETLNHYFSKKFFTVLKNYFASEAPLTRREKRMLSARIINDTLVQELTPWFRRYSLASNVLGYLIMKRKVRAFTDSAKVYFWLVSIIER